MDAFTQRYIHTRARTYTHNSLSLARMRTRKNEHTLLPLGGDISHLYIRPIASGFFIGRQWNFTRVEGGVASRNIGNCRNMWRVIQTYALHVIEFSHDKLLLKHTNVRLGNSGASLVTALTARKRSWLDIKEKRHAAIPYHRKRSAKRWRNLSRKWNSLHHHHWTMNKIPSFKTWLEKIWLVFGLTRATDLSSHDTTSNWLLRTPGHWNGGTRSNFLRSDYGF